MISKDKVIVILLTAGVVSIRICTFIIAPLWQDSLRVTYDPPDNFTPYPEEVTWPVSEITLNSTLLEREIDPYFCSLSQAIFTTVFYGIGYLIVRLFFPHKITDRERSYPRRHIVSAGLAAALSATLMNLCLSGSRTAPYLIALLGNFLVPIQFLTRLIILRKRPTRRKFFCAIAVIIGELISLIPSIFPSLEPARERSQDGGATGAGAVLWPLAFLVALVPGTVNNALMERSLKTKKSSNSNNESEDAEEDIDDQKHINIFYYLFWYGIWTLVFTTAIFWITLIPGFGTVPSIQMFWKRMTFNFGCLLAGKDCSPKSYILGWFTTVINVLAFIINSYMLRYSEGANYFTVAQTLRSPILLLFWTLFHENPFYWNPHVYLTTYLAIAALCIMVPAVHIYNTGPPEKSVSRIIPRIGSKPDRVNLLDNAEENEQDGIIQ